MKCWHKFMGGFGGMGDGYKCVKCGCEEIDIPELFFVLLLILGRTLRNNGTYGSFDEYPYVRKFSEKITLSSDSENWIEFFNRKGELIGRNYSS